MQGKLCVCLLAVSVPHGSSAVSAVSLGPLYLNFFLSCSLCLPPFALLSFHFRKQLFLHKLQSCSQQHVQQRQIACSCPGTSRFILAQTQHSLPGTTSVTRTPASPSCQQPSPRQDPCIDTLGPLDNVGRFCTSRCSHWLQSERALTLLTTPGYTSLQVCVCYINALPGLFED